MFVSLTQCLYGMELYKKPFSSGKAERDCLSNIIRHFIDTQSNGKLAGPIDIREFRIDLDDGQVSFPEPVQVDALLNAIDTLKFLPPEVLTERSVWTKRADDFLLSAILFCVEFLKHPFDGKLVYEKPVTDRKWAVKFYSNPVFVFDTADSCNGLLAYNDGRAIMKWEAHSADIREYYIKNFTSGAAHADMRADAEDAKKLFGSSGNNAQAALLAINDKQFHLYEGFELYERDVDSGSITNDKLAVVIKSPQNDVLELGNASDDTWSVYLPDSKEVMVLPKSAAPIIQGATISIGEYLANIY